MPGHVVDVGCASPITGDATITAISSGRAQESQLTCEERSIASSFAGEAAGSVGSSDRLLLPRPPDGQRLRQGLARRERPLTRPDLPVTRPGSRDRLVSSISACWFWRHATPARAQGQGTSVDLTGITTLPCTDFLRLDGYSAAAIRFASSPGNTRIDWIGRARRVARVGGAAAHSAARSVLATPAPRGGAITLRQARTAAEPVVRRMERRS